VFARAHHALRLFLDDEERAMFLAQLGGVIDALGWRCWSYCLMDTHVHLVVCTPDPNLDVGMQRLLSNFALRINARRRQHGPVFGGRYGSRLLVDQAHLAEALRYVPLNPTRAGMCREPSGWAWSSHRALAGEIPAPPFLAVADVYDLVCAITGRMGPTGYVELLRQAADEPTVRDAPSFAAGHAAPASTALGALLGDGSGAAISVAHREHGYSLREIGRALGCHVSTVSRRLSRHDAMSRVAQRV
jgi:REP element-mobilizing transposase RayT